MLTYSYTELLTNPILSLLPKYTEEDYNQLKNSAARKTLDNDSKLIIFLANLLYKIKLDDKEKNLLRKSLQKDKELLKLMYMKKEITSDIVDEVYVC